MKPTRRNRTLEISRPINTSRGPIVESRRSIVRLKRSAMLLISAATTMCCATPIFSQVPTSGQIRASEGPTTLKCCATKTVTLGETTAQAPIIITAPYTATRTIQVAEVVERLSDGSFIVRIDGTEYRAIGADRVREIEKRKVDLEGCR